MRMSTKMLGPTRVNAMNAQSFDIIAEVLGVSSVLVEDVDKLQRMERRFERRETGRLHPPKTRISKAALERAAPVIRREFPQAGARARNALLTGEHRSRIARKAARARWRAHRRALREARP